MDVIESPPPLKTRKLPVRHLAILIILIGAAVLFLGTGHFHYPIQKWLFPRYAGYWLSALLMMASFLSLGHAIVRRLCALGLSEHLCVSFIVGMYGFECLMVMANFLQQIHWGTYFVVPAVCLAIGGRSLYRYLRPAVRHLRFARQRRSPLGLGAMLAVVFGIVGFLMLYFLIINPENTQFDARWKHLRLTEEFMIHGGFRRFPEGWTFATRPHVASFLYLWTFLPPGYLPFDRVVNAAHAEFAIFVWTTIVGIPTLLRRLVPGADPRFIWAARFLFPGIFLYDSSLAIGADHIGAAYCIPLFIMAIAVTRAFAIKPAILMGVVIAGGGIVKDTIGFMLIPPAVLTLVILGLREIVRSPARAQAFSRVLVAALCVVGGAFVFSAPHWLKNWVVYGNPVYPVMSNVFHSRPWTPDASYIIKYGYAGGFWAPERNLQGIVYTVRALFDWSLIPNDWKSFHGRVPVIGSLFTLLLATLPFTRAPRRLWMLVGWCHVSIFLWYSVHHQDRYLQGIMPWLTACLIAMSILIWRTREMVLRLALGFLFVSQVVWGADAYFFQTHAMVRSPLKKTIDMLSAGHEKKYQERFTIGQDKYEEIGRKLPKNAVVLMHEVQNYFGLPRPVIADYTQWQYGISYGLLESPRQVHDALTALGATHMVWNERSRAFDSIAGDLMFYSYALRFGVNRQDVRGMNLAELPKVPPAETVDTFQDKVMVLGCGKPYADGLYRIRDLAQPNWGFKQKEILPPRQAVDSKAAAVELTIAMADYVIIDPKCETEFDGRWAENFEKMFARDIANKNVKFVGHRRVRRNP